MKILLTGATGFIGGHIKTALIAAGHELVPCSRQSGCDFNRMTSAQDWLPMLDGVDAVINAVGIIVESKDQHFDVLHRQAPVALFKACAEKGVKKVIQISALGADENSFTPYQLSKKAADDTLRSLDTLDWFILQPSLVYGEGGESMKMFSLLASLPVIPLVGDGQYQVQPVHVSDVVATVMKCLEPDAKAHQTLAVVGAYPLSFAEWMQKIRQSKGRKRGLLFKTPFALMLQFANIGKFIMPVMSPDNLKMLKAGNTADVGPVNAFLGCSTLSPEQGLQR
ncbi:MAG: NAD-dependent epimerase/dehydratase family protein [Thiolinea sp.]